MGGVRESDRAFLDIVLERGGASRADVAGLSGMSKPTASEAADRLVAAGILRESGAAHGRRGRSPLLYEPDGNFGLGLAIVAQARSLDIGIVGMNGASLSHQRVQLDPRLSAGQFSVVLSEQVQKAVATMNAPCRTAAVSLAAPVDPSTGRVVRLGEAPFPAADVDVVSVLKPLVLGQVVVDNDVNWTALAMCAQYPELNCGTVLHVHLGTGLGAALTVEGQIVHGRRGAFGELGRLRSGGRTVTDRLGELGVLEEGGFAISISTILALVEQGNSSSRVDQLVQILAETVGVAVMLIDPDRLVFTGPLAEATVVERLLAQLATSLDVGAVPDTLHARGGEEAPVDGARSAAHELLVESALEACV